jgi:hypothetical protein
MESGFFPGGADSIYEDLEPKAILESRETEDGQREFLVQWQDDREDEWVRAESRHLGCLWLSAGFHLYTEFWLAQGQIDRKQNVSCCVLIWTLARSTRVSLLAARLI